MIDIKGGWKSVADKGKWSARGASFVTKAKATKVVWFPPEPVETGKKAGSTATKTTKRATKRATGAAKKTTNGGKKTTRGARNVTDRLRRKKA
jgi:hypothetical protein